MPQHNEDARGHHSPLPFRDHPMIGAGAIRLRAECTRVVDGDTFDLLVECQPNHIIATERVRLAVVDTPEIYGRNAEPAGQVAKARVEELIGHSAPLQILTDNRRDKYGRLIVFVFYLEPLSNRWTSLGDTLVSEGLGVEVDY